MKRLALLAALSLSACATRRVPPAGPALSPFEFVLSPEECQRLKDERRTYRATEKTAGYVGGAGALVGTALLAIPSLRDERAAQGAAAGVSLLAGGVAVFSGSQVEVLDQDLAAGGCDR